MAAPTKRYTSIMEIVYPWEGAQPDDAVIVDQMNDIDAVALYALQAGSLVINVQNFAWNGGTGELTINNLVMTSSFGGGTFSIGAPFTLPAMLDGYYVYVTVPLGLWSTNETLIAGHFNVFSSPFITLNKDKILFGKRVGSEFHMAIPNANSLT